MSTAWWLAGKVGSFSVDRVLTNFSQISVAKAETILSLYGASGQSEERKVIRDWRGPSGGSINRDTWQPGEHSRGKHPAEEKYRGGER